MTAVPTAYLLDSDVLIYYLTNISPAVTLVEGLARGGFALSAVTYMEVLEGIDRGQDSESINRRFQTLSRNVPTLPFSQPEAIEAVRIRKALRHHGRSIRPRHLDILIAATAVSRGLTLVTNNAADFRDVPNLQILDAHIVVQDYAIRWLRLPLITKASTTSGS